METEVLYRRSTIRQTHLKTDHTSRWRLQLTITVNNQCTTTTTTTTTVLRRFSGTTWVSRCQKRTSGLYAARED